MVARGIRNTVGFDWHPVTKNLWFNDHGRDWMGDDGPEDELKRITRTGQNFGFPYCHATGIADKDFKKANPCEDVTLPVQTTGPNAAVMGLHFYTGNMFPAKYKNEMFVPCKGSWNGTKKSGADVVMVRADADGKNQKVSPFVTGFLDEKGETFGGRPAYILQVPSVAGQPKVFLANKLVLIREGLREIPKMKGLLDGVSDADIVALATYFSAQTRATVTGPFVTRCEILNQTARECRARLVAPIRLLQI